MVLLVIIIACLLGAIVGLNAPIISYTYSSYLAIAIVAALDSVFGGIASVINKKFDIKHIIKYLLKEIFPLFMPNKILASIIITPPIIFFITNFSFKKIKPNITRKTLESCLSIEKVDGLSPYLASILSLSVNA